MDFKPVPGFTGVFASDEGIIRKKSNGVWMTTPGYPQADGYLRLTLTDDEGNPRTVDVGELVWSAHVGERKPRGQYIRHGSEGGGNNHIDNLLGWGTPSRNVQDDGAGENHHRAKLTDDLVIKYRALVNAGQTTQAAAARELGVCPQTISRALTGATWKHLNDVAPPVAKKNARPSRFDPGVLQVLRRFMSTYEIGQRANYSRHCICFYTSDCPQYSVEQMLAMQGIAEPVVEHTIVDVPPIGYAYSTDVFVG